MGAGLTPGSLHQLPNLTSVYRPAHSINTNRHQSMDISVAHRTTLNNYMQIQATPTQESNQITTRRSNLRSSFTNKDAKRRSTLLRYLSKDVVTHPSHKSQLQTSLINDLQDKAAQAVAKCASRRIKYDSLHSRAEELSRLLSTMRCNNQVLIEGVLALRAKTALRAHLRQQVGGIEGRRSRLAATPPHCTAERYFELKLANERLFKSLMEGRLLQACKDAKKGTCNPVLIELMAEAGRLEMQVRSLGGDPELWCVPEGP